ncbi:MAG TPA: thermonuclease family protein [Xanthobacteraceae bacterium]|jgi:endonuclease YncB( thermonuclease family)|nr:thermonuclease family protein [Xanthobacteraceae bacterium]
MFLGSFSSHQTVLALTGVAFTLGALAGSVGADRLGEPHWDLARRGAGLYVQHPAHAPDLAHAAPAAPVQSNANGQTYPAEVLRVIDGDTFVAAVHLWPGLQITTKVRLRRIDAAEMHARCPQERRLAEAARDGLTTLLAGGNVTLTQIKPDRYGGRVDADAVNAARIDVGEAMLARGLARPYNGGRRQPWC